MQTGGVGNSSCSVSAAVSDESRVGRPGHASRPQRADLLPVSSGLLRRDDWLRQPGRTSALLTYLIPEFFLADHSYDMRR